MFKIKLIERRQMRTWVYEVKPKGKKACKVTYIPKTTTGKRHWVSCNCKLWVKAIGFAYGGKKKPKGHKPSTDFHLVCQHGFAVLKHRGIIRTFPERRV